MEISDVGLARPPLFWQSCLCCKISTAIIPLRPVLVTYNTPPNSRFLSSAPELYTQGTCTLPLYVFGLSMTAASAMTTGVGFETNKI